jgi:hypothetical protein
VLAPVPNLDADIDWKTQGPELRKRIIQTLSEHMLPDLEHHLVTDFYMTPEDFATDYLSVGGAGFSVSPLFTQSAWFRFHNKAEGPDNLFLVGAGTHPGAGLPGVVSSAKVLDRLVPDSVSESIYSCCLNRSSHASELQSQIDAASGKRTGSSREIIQICRSISRKNNSLRIAPGSTVFAVLLMT